MIIFNYYERTTLKSKLVTLALNMSQMKGIGPEDLEKVVVLFKNATALPFWALKFPCYFYGE